MADVVSSDDVKDTAAGPADVPEVELLPLQEKLGGDQVEVDVSKLDDGVLDFEATSALLPVPLDGQEEVEEVERKSLTAAGSRKPSTASTGNRGPAVLIDDYYDDDDWATDREGDAEGEGEERRSKNPVVFFVQIVQSIVKGSLAHIDRVTGGHLLAIVLILGFLAFFIKAMTYHFGDEASIRLVVCTVIGGLVIVRKYVFDLLKTAFVKVNGSTNLSPRAKYAVGKMRWVTRWLLYLGLAGGVAYIIVLQANEVPSRVRSLPGLAVFLFICLLFSSSPRTINWHTIYWSLGLQFLLAYFALKWETGRDVFLWIQDRLDEFFANGESGSKFIFGESYKEHFMIFGAIPLVLLSNATLVMLYYLGAMQFVIGLIGSFLSFVLDTTPVESMSVAASIFMEGVISVLTLKPYLGRLSKSQLFLVVTAMFSSLGGAYLGLLSGIGVSMADSIPALLISAPATFAVCKLMVPESHKMARKLTREGAKKYQAHTESTAQRKNYSNILDAAQDGAVSMLAVTGSLLAVGFVFFSYISWVNNTLNWLGERVGLEELSIEKIFSYVLFPVSLAMGVDWEDCRRVAMLLGFRIGSVNIIAFMKLLELKVNKGYHLQYMMATNFTGPVSRDGDDVTLDLWNKTLKHGFLSDRSETIATYSLCGYSSFIFSSMAIGIMYTLLPRRRPWLAKIFGAALIAGNISNCMTGCFAGLFY